MALPAPLVYEINARCWLRELAARAGRSVTLASVPDAELDAWVRLGFTHLWLMGVWRTAPASVAFSRQLPALRREWAQSLPDLRSEEITGSPYAIAAYEVAGELGGERGLAEFRARLARRGLKLLLDFIPNHVGLGHHWLAEHPEAFVQAPAEFAGGTRVESPVGSRWIAHGKDPFFPPWADTLQLDHRHPATRALLIDELRAIASRCDGVRCDMAMLVLAEVFARTWAEFPAPEPSAQGEFWAAAIPAVKAAQPDFLFLAEAYWDREAQLLELGFDFAYDKRLLDCLVARDPGGVQAHLYDRTAGQVDRAAHFLENHDEARIASLLSPAEHRAAALLVLGLPGLRLLHEGQLTGARRHASVHLNRRPPEPADPEIAAWYDQLFLALQQTAVGRGRGRLLRPKPAWAGNPTDRNFVAVQWQAAGPGFDLVIVNLAPHAGQCVIDVATEGVAGADWRMADLLGDQRFERSGREIAARGLYFDLPGHGAQLFQFRPLGGA